MELNSGICSICDSGKEIVNPESSGAFWEMICGIFKDELDSLSVLKSELKICPTCIFDANLINAKKDIFKNEINDVDTKSIDKCRFCKDDTSILKVENSEFLKKFESRQKFKGKGWSLICASCYYVINATFNLRTKLLCKLSELKTLSSTERESVHSIDNEVEYPSYKTLKKARKMTLDENNDEFSKNNSFNLCDSGSEEQTDENILYNPSKPREKKDNNSKEYVKKIKNKKIHIEDDVSSSDIFIEEIKKEEEYVLVSDEEHPPKKNRKSKNKKIEETTTCEILRKSNKEKIKRNKYRGMKYFCLDSLSSSDSVKGSNKTSRKRKFFASSEDDFSPKLKKFNALETSEVHGLDMSRIICFMPLSKTNVKVNDIIKQDAKFYSCIPYVKLSVLKKSDKFEKRESDMLEQIWTKRPCASPTGIIKRTPPIKIKLKKVTKLKNDVIQKKDSRKNAPKDESFTNGIVGNEKKIVAKVGESSTNATMFNEFKKKEVVVKVERMILPTLENESKFEKNGHFKKNELELSTEKATYESVLKNTSGVGVTSKKKKKVHFNDTPTIIITGDEMSDDLDSAIEDEDISKRINTRNGKTLKYEKEVLQDEISIEIDSEESGDEKTETAEEESDEVVDKEIIIEEIEEAPDIESENVEAEAKEVAKGEEAKQFTPGCDQVAFEKECNKIDSNMEGEEKIDNEEMKESEQIANSTQMQTMETKFENDSVCEAITCEKGNKPESEPSEKGESSSSVKSTGENEETKNLKDQKKKEKLLFEEKRNIEKKCDVEEKDLVEQESGVEENIQVEKEKLLIEEKGNVVKECDVEEKDLIEKESGVKEKILVVENIVVAAKSGVKEKSDILEGKTTLIIESDDEKEETEDIIGDLQIVDECSDGELEETESEKKIIIAHKDSEELSENVDVEEVEKKQEDDLDADKIVVNDIVLSGATTASEDFGSLIDEVQKCLTSSKDLSSETNDDPVLELHASTDDIDKVFEKDDSLSCLNDIDRGLESSFNENLIEDDKTSNVETETSSLDKGIKRRLSVEDDNTEKSAKDTK